MARGGDQGADIVWFRQDLRLADHAALHAALDAGRRVVCAYVLDDAAAGAWAWGGSSRWWLHHSLRSLDEALRARGASLVLRRGDAATELAALAREAGATRIHAGRMHEPWGRHQEDAVAKALPDGALVLHRTATLTTLESIHTKTGGVYGMYTPYSRTVLAMGDPPPPLPPPRTIPGADGLRSDALDSWGLLPTKPDWAAGLRETWTPGEAGAASRLKRFVAAAAGGYDVGRNLPGEEGTSMLSPHLHWGEISPGQVWHAAAQADGPGRAVFLREIVWREFSAYLLWHNPHLPDRALRPRFDALPWRRAKPELQAWQRGRTGVPIVDAGMRQLWQLGWMHNRVRMITGSFLVKHLLIDWRDGEAWFWDTLVDADLASNAGNWQWIAGSGIDSQPFFRIFNPVSQGKRFDADGAYVRRFVPELAGLPDRVLHAPWTASAAELDKAGVVLGKTYPHPIVGLDEGRARALDAYRRTVREAAA